MVGNLVFWGHWPVLRRFSRLPSLHFISQTILSLCILSCMMITFIMYSASGAVGRGWETAATVSTATTLATLAGAFNAFGDWGISIAVEELGVGVGAPLVFSANLVLGSGLDYVIESNQSDSRRVLCHGLTLLPAIGIALIGIACNAMSSQGKIIPLV